MKCTALLLSCLRQKSIMRLLIVLLCGILMPRYTCAQLQGRQLIDSLSSQVKHSKEDTHKVALLDRLSFAYSDINPAVGIQYARQSLELSERLEWPRGVAASLSDMAVNYAALSEYDTALAYHMRAATVYKSTGNLSALASVDANIATIYMDKGQYPQALEYSFRALKIKEETGDNNGLAATLENIGTIYLRQQNYDKTMHYYSRALDMQRLANDKAGMARILGNMGIVQDAKGNYQAALQHHKGALKINTELGNVNSMQINHANIGYVYYHMKNYKAALEHQSIALHMSRESGSKNSTAINLGNLGETYYDMAMDTTHNQPRKKELLHLAIDHLEQAVALCKEIDFAGPLTEFGQYLSNAYYAAGDYQKAFIAYKEYDALKDSVYSVESQVKISEIETKREMELQSKELQIERLKVQEKNNEQTIYIISILLLVVCLGIGARLIYNYRHSHSMLQQQKAEHLELISEQIEEIKKQRDALEEIAHLQSHDVRGPVATILGLVQLYNFKDANDPINKTVMEGISRITGELDKAVQEVIQKKNHLGSDAETGV